ncbi:MAG: redox-regulated ATPase YchF [Patescibacteria group bacterium]|nr:redox-regulated ATPase YchF [Patescibacteria group bacterium]
MSLSIGIVGLPNAGKSTLFNALLKKQIADVAPYPFCTVEPNKGIVEVPDGRLPVLAKITGVSKIIPAVVEFIDIAGLVKGAHKGEGLGNKFLANIREVSIICHLIRFFKDDNIAHVEGRVDPESDVEIINSELILADLQTLDKQKEVKFTNNKEEKIRWEAIVKLKQELNQGKLATRVDLSDQQRELIKELFLLTDKPVIYLANVGEDQLADQKVISDFKYQPVIAISAKMEFELAALSDEDQKEYLTQYHLSEPGLNRLIKQAYQTSGLISFFTTTGNKEVRAWTIKQETDAKDAAGAVHSDFKDNFIKADVVSFEDFVQYGGWVNARAAGKVRSEGKDYLVADGEVVEFKIGV